MQKAKLKAIEIEKKCLCRLATAAKSAAQPTLSQLQQSFLFCDVSGTAVTITVIVTTPGQPGIILGLSLKLTPKGVIFCSNSNNKNINHDYNTSNHNNILMKIMIMITITITMTMTMITITDNDVNKNKNKPLSSS